MEKFLVFSLPFAVLLMAAYFPLGNSWVVLDSRSDMLAMSSETDDIIVPMSDSSEEDAKKDSTVPVTKIKAESEEEPNKDENEMEDDSTETESNEKPEPNNGKNALPTGNDEPNHFVPVSEEDVTMPALEEDDPNANKVNETSAESVEMSA